MTMNVIEILNQPQNFGAAMFKEKVAAFDT